MGEDAPVWNLIIINDIIGKLLTKGLDMPFKNSMMMVTVLIAAITATTVSYAEDTAAALQASCEKQRLQCQKDWAVPNSSGVPVTSPEKTKMCWDMFYRCANAGSANQITPESKPDTEAKSDALPQIKHFETRSLSNPVFIEDCLVTGADVKCTGRFETLPAGIIRFETTTTGKLSGRVMTGHETSRSDLSSDAAGCSFHQEDNWPVTVTLGPNNEATIQVGSVQSRITSSCAGTQSNTYPGSTTKATWKIIK